MHYQSPTPSHTLERTEYDLFKYHIMPSNYGRYLAFDFAADILGGGGGEYFSSASIRLPNKRIYFGLLASKLFKNQYCKSDYISVHVY